MCALDISGENTFENKKGFLPFPVKQGKMEMVRFGKKRAFRFNSSTDKGKW